MTESNALLADRATESHAAPEVRNVQVGDVRIDAVTEWRGEFGPMTAAFPKLADEYRDLDLSWLAPHYMDAENEHFVAQTQSFILRSAGKTIVIDTGAGNDKERPGFPLFDHLHTDFLDDLALMGVTPEEVDLVLTTHCHIDHVGWNTRWENGEWVPTFPNARYVLAEDDFNYWNPESGHTRVGDHSNQNDFQDSVAPIHRAGLLDLWSGTLDIDENIRLVQLPGHTPGSAAIEVTSGGEKALFVGDMIHNPVQLAHPDVHFCFDENVAEAREARLKVLSWAADEGRLLYPGHFHTGGRIERQGSAFRVIAP